MDEEQRIMRYVFPGLAAVLVTGIALGASFPHFICHVVTQLRVEGWVGVFIGSGALGFLLAQMYSAFPCSIVDYREWFRHNSVDDYRLLLFGKDPSRYGDLKEIEILWNKVGSDSRHAKLTAWDLRPSSLCQKIANCRAKRPAWDLGTFLWHSLIADQNEALDKSTNRRASWMAAIGATFVGVVLGFLAWLLVVLHASAASRPPCVMGAVFSAILFILVLLALGRAHCQLHRSIGRIGRFGLATHFARAHLKDQL